MKIGLIILLASITISAQVDSVTNALSFYPLHVGDYWQYEVTRQYYGPDTTWIVHKEVVGDTIALNGKRYFIVNEVGIFNPNYSGLRVSYIRIDSLFANVYRYSNYDNDEILIDSLLSQKGDIIFDCYKCIGDTTKELFGEITRTKLREMYCLTDSHNDGWELAADLGVIMGYYTDRTVTLINYQYDLLYAKVADREYGELSYIPPTEVVPMNYALYQNYPNPFNPNTTIRYSLPEGTHTKLAICDVLGNEIKVIVNEFQNTGIHEVNFDGSSLASGVYLYNLIVGARSITKKFVLLK